MSSIKTYTAIFGVLMLFSTTQAAMEMQPWVEIPYGPLFGAIMVLSTIKALAVAGWYMHLKDEPRAISYLAGGAVIGVLALVAGAAYSIT
jgi:cytochrome c oxidase subunit 4